MIDTYYSICLRDILDKNLILCFDAEVYSYLLMMTLTKTIDMQVNTTLIHDQSCESLATSE